MPSPFTDLAKLAYQAYGDKAEWKNYAGDPMPRWDDLGDVIQDRWCAAAEAIYAKVGPPVITEGLEE